MANDLLIIDGGPAQVPAHIAKRYEGRVSNVMEPSISLPSLTFTGKVWTVGVGAEKIKLVSRDSEGDEVPMASVAVVILDYAKRRGRTYYPGAYDPDNVSQPDCWSKDGITPNVDVPEDTRQSDKCAGCPMSIKGSKITDAGNSITACSEHRILAVIPAKKMDGSLPPLRLKIAITSDYDGRSKEAHAKGLCAFSQYLSFLKQRGIEYTDTIVTKLSFDSSVAYPKIFFKADRWLDETQVDQVEKIKEGPGVETILGDTHEMPVGGRAALPASRQVATVKTEAPKDAAAPAETPAQKKAREAKEKKQAKEAEKAAAQAAEPGASDEQGDEEDEDAKALAALQAKIEAKKKGNGSKPTTAAGGASSAATEIGGDVETAKPKQTAKTVTEAKPSGDLAPEVTSILNEWD